MDIATFDELSARNRNRFPVLATYEVDIALLVNTIPKLKGVFVTHGIYIDNHNDILDNTQI